RRDIDPQAARAVRPLLAQHALPGHADGAPTVLHVEADAPGADWGTPGRECAMVALYVDGAYHSTVIVMGERTGGYDVNLGVLGPGAHTVELRAATDIAPVTARVGAVTARAEHGDRALLDAHAPVLEMRDVDRSARSSVGGSDAPMLLVPAETRLPNGNRLVEYRVIFSNEDGGTPVPRLFSTYGRGVDAEPIYRVTFDPAGRVVDERYQAALHRWLPYDGARDPGGRPILRVSTPNNMVSARVHAAGTRSERWSEAPRDVVAAVTSEFDAMRAAPWTWQISSKELLREGKAASEGAARGADQVGDPRRYVYLGPLGAAARAAIELAGGLVVVLADGRHVLARLATGFANGEFGQSALELPTGASADAVRGVALLGVRALVLDAAFGVRELTHTA
ncbi:MAG: hypothetical protein JWM98_2656, partial [Thermoleophilia bacterium]|nr:hypothetical protein [Thermoleophilia bacterium]